MLLATTRPRRMILVACAALAAVVLGAMSLRAQGPGATGDQPGTDRIVDRSIKPTLGDGPVVVELFMTSRVINSIILALSVLALLLFFFSLLTIKGPSMSPPGFIDEINKLVRAREYAKAADFCRRNRSIFVASIIQRCVENPAKPHAVLIEMIDSEGRRRADVLWNRVGYLSDVSNVAPMLGLLGTVVGMIHAFFYALPEHSASISSQVLSRAIGGAMATTMFGLIVGIAALVFYSIVRSRLTRALAETEQVVHSLADQLKRDEP